MNNRECDFETCVKPALRGRKLCEEHEGMQEWADEINIGQALGVPFPEVRDKLSVGYRSAGPEETINVYFIQPEGEEVVKIGQAVSVPHRLAMLQTANHKELTLLASAELPMGYEAKFHQRLKAHRTRGEWFWLHAEVLEVIEAVKTGDRWVIDKALKPKPKKLLYRRH